MIITFKKISILFIIGLIVFSCKKKEDEPNNSNEPTVTEGTFILHLHTHIDSTEIDAYDTIYSLSNGRKMSLHLAQMYFSDVQLVKIDGAIVDITTNSFLKVFENEQYLIGNVPVGNYKGVRFKVGLNSTKNALNPTSSSESEILNNSEMWFGSSAQPDGYVFLNVQGTIDTTSSMNGTPVNFEYRIGTNSSYTQITMPDQYFTVLKGIYAYKHVIVDYSKIFEGVTLNDPNNLTVHSLVDNSLPFVETLKNNIPLMFRYE